MQTILTLKGASLVFVLSWLLHTGDHVRRGLAATPEGVTWAGTFVALLACSVITLILVGHSSAPMLALLVFPSIALGVSATHLLPNWGFLSDPILVGSNSDKWTILAVVPEIGAAALVGFVAWQIVSRGGYQSLIPTSDWIEPSA